MRKLFKERKLFKGGNYMRKYGTYLVDYLTLLNISNVKLISKYVPKVLYKFAHLMDIISAISVV